MFSDHQLEEIWKRARNVDVAMPVTYHNLMGTERLAVLRLLDEPIQSTLHAIVQQNVPPNTACVYKGCHGTLNKTGRCSEKCEQSHKNVVQDIIECLNCDSYEFPCPTCHCVIFRKQLKQYLGDY
jgi:hypothetical protein